MKMTMANKANGVGFPKNAYMKPPKGYPMSTPNAMLPRTMPSICDLVFSSGYTYCVTVKIIKLDITHSE